MAFADHENTAGDDEGSVAVIDLDGHEKKLASGLVFAGRDIVVTRG